MSTHAHPDLTHTHTPVQQAFRAVLTPFSRPATVVWSEGKTGEWEGEGEGKNVEQCRRFAELFKMLMSF